MCIRNAPKYERAVARQCINFVCRKCSGSSDSADNDGDVSLDGDVIEKMTKFSYLEDALISVDRVQEDICKNKIWMEKVLQKSFVAEIAWKIVLKLC